MKNATLLTLCLTLCSTTLAQSGSENRVKLQPVLDLAQVVRLLPTLEKDKTTALSKTQAKTLLPILTGLQKVKAVPPNNASLYLTQIQTKILTSKQLTALKTLITKDDQAKETARAQRQASDSGSGSGSGSGLGPGEGVTPQQLQTGQINPFTNPTNGPLLKTYIALLQKK